MAKKKRNSILTKEQEKQLQNIANEMVGLAANLMDEYVEDFDLPHGGSTGEYDVVRLKTDTDEGGLRYTTSLLKRMGDKGWELVNITPLGDKDGPRYGIFKRMWDEGHGDEGDS